MISWHMQGVYYILDMSLVVLEGCMWSACSFCIIALCCHIAPYCTGSMRIQEITVLPSAVLFHEMHVV